jgi:hypothetical protein
MTNRDVAHWSIQQLSALYKAQKTERASTRDCGDFEIVGVVARM